MTGYGYLFLALGVVIALGIIGSLLLKRYMEGAYLSAVLLVFYTIVTLLNPGLVWIADGFVSADNNQFLIHESEDKWTLLHAPSKKTFALTLIKEDTGKLYRFKLTPTQDYPSVYKDFTLIPSSTGNYWACTGCNTGGSPIPAVGQIEVLWSMVWDTKAQARSDK